MLKAESDKRFTHEQKGGRKKRKKNMHENDKIKLSVNDKSEKYHPEFIIIRQIHNCGLSPVSKVS